MFLLSLNRSDYWVRIQLGGWGRYTAQVQTVALFLNYGPQAWVALRAVTLGSRHHTRTCVRRCSASVGVFWACLQAEVTSCPPSRLMEREQNMGPGPGPGARSRCPQLDAAFISVQIQLPLPVSPRNP